MAVLKRWMHSILDLFGKRETGYRETKQVSSWKRETEPIVFFLVFSNFLVFRGGGRRGKTRGEGVKTTGGAEEEETGGDKIILSEEGRS